MRNFTWNRFPIKYLLIDSLLTPIVVSTYLNKDMCKFESSQKDESRCSRLIPRKHTETLVLLSVHYDKISLFWSLIIFAYLSFTTVREQKIGFNSCECIQFFNIANTHVLNVWGKCIFICNNKIFFLWFFSVYSFYNATFFHYDYVIKPPQPSSAIYGTPPFTGNQDGFFSIH